MQRNSICILVTTLTILLSLFTHISASFAKPKSPPSAFDPARHLSLSKIHAGMKGYGLSIFKGTKIEKFDVTVLDVIHNFNPKLDVILVELSGQRLKETGVIAGMSGSPVYFKDPDDGKFKMAGAVAYGWPLSRPGFATGGVQPIEQMLAVQTAKSTKQTSVHADRQLFVETMKALANNTNLEQFDRFVWINTRKNTEKNIQPYKNQQSEDKQSFLPIGLRPLATPISVSVISFKTFRKLQSIFKQENLPLIMAGASSGGVNQPNDTKQNDIIPAGVLSVPLVIGDLNLAGIGTVTERIGDRFWGFGHPMFAEGPVELPIAAGVIHSVIANLVNSFKLGSAYKPIGTLYHDQATAVAGKLGPVPKLTPITVNVDFTGQKLAYHYQLAMHKKLSPILLLICVNESILARKDLPELHSIKYTGELKFEDFAPIKIDNITSDASVKPILADIAEPTFIMLNNDFKMKKLEKVNLDVKVENVSKYAEITQASLDKNSYEPHEQANILVRLARIQKSDFVTKISFTIPSDLPDGKYSITIGGMYSRLLIDRMANPYIYKPTNVKELYNMIKHVTKFRSDRFYITIKTKKTGLGTHGVAMPALPESRLTQIAKAEPALTSMIFEYKQFEIPSEYVIYGKAKLSLNIKRNK